MKQWHFYDKVYRRWVALMIGPLADFRKLMEDDGFNEMEIIVQAKGLCVEMNDDNNTMGQRCTIIWMPDYETATLVHEITHLVMMQFTQTGVPISRDNTEAFAFYAEFWFNEITRARRKYPDGRTPAQAKARLSV